MSTPRTMYLPMYSSDQHPSPEASDDRARPAEPFPATGRPPARATGTRTGTRPDGPAPPAAPRKREDILAGAGRDVCPVPTGSDPVTERHQARYGRKETLVPIKYLQLSI